MVSGKFIQHPDTDQPTDSVLPIVARGVSFIGRDGRALLDSVDMSIKGEGALVLIGPNGAGKSLLLRTLAALVQPSNGSVTWNGRLPSRRLKQRIGFVFQRPVLFRRTVLGNLVMSMHVNGVSKPASQARALDLLADAGLSHLASASARTLSGGEQQRLSIIRALASEPDVIFLDEPSAHLDPASTAAIEDDIVKARAKGTRLVLVTHDLGQARRLADEVVFMNHGQIQAWQDVSSFFAKPDSRDARAFVAGDLVL